MSDPFPAVFGTVALLLIAGFAIAGSRKDKGCDIDAPEGEDKYIAAGRAGVHGGDA